MSDIEREEFEKAVADKWSDSYSFTRFGDEDYFDEIVEGMWRGWQARAKTDACCSEIPNSCEPVYFYQEPEAVGSNKWREVPGRTLERQRQQSHFRGFKHRTLYTHPVSAAKQAVSVPQQWRDTMEELAADLESEIENRRSGDLDRRIERDLIVVREARALLAEQEQGHE